MKAKRAINLLKEDSGTTGGVATFYGRSGVGVDAVFAGGYHPEYGQIEKLLQLQLDDRKAKRDAMVKALGDDNVGDELPLGGYYDFETDLLINSYEELEYINQMHREYNDENTPEHETEYKVIDKYLNYDEISDELDIDKYKNKTNKMKNIDLGDIYDREEKIDISDLKNDTNRWKNVKSLSDIYRRI